MAKQSAGRTGEQPTTPKEFAETTPSQGGPDTAPWSLVATNKNTEAVIRLEAKLDSMIDRLDSRSAHLASKIDEAKADVRDIRNEIHKHGKWIYAANAILGVIIAVIAFLAPRVWDLLIAKPPAH